MKHLILFVMSFFLLFSCQERQKTAVVAGEEILDIPPCVVTSPPDSLKLDKFYKKYVDVNGIPLISSWRVPDSCFTAAHRTLYAMTSMLDKKILEAMWRANARVAIMARY